MENHLEKKKRPQLALFRMKQKKKPRILKFKGTGEIKIPAPFEKSKEKIKSRQLVPIRLKRQKITPRYLTDIPYLVNPV